MAAFRGRGKQKTDANSPAYFTQKDGQRVANVVHAYETSRRGRNPSQLPRAPGGGGAVVEAFYVGGWVKGASKQVTFTSDTMVTALAYNMIRTVAVPYTNSTARLCTVSLRSDGSGAYILINSEC
jgi:hypothetical protein